MQLRFLSLSSSAKDSEMESLVSSYHAEAIANLLKNNNFSSEVIERLEKEVTVELSNRLRTRGGTASHNGILITLNYRLLKENPDQLKNVYVHELAHIVCNRVYLRKCGHSNLWKAMMSSMGEKPSRTHSMDVSKYKKAKPRLFAHTCGCNIPVIGKRVYMLKRGMHNKALHGLLRCRDCFEVLKLDKEKTEKSANSIFR